MKRLFVTVLLVALFASMFVNLGSGYLGGCVMSLPFNEGSGATAYDETGNGNNGAISGAAWVNGRFGTALSFDGTDNVIVLASASLDFYSSAFSFFAWIKPTNVSGKHQIFHREVSGTDLRVDLALNEGKLDILVYNGSIFNQAGDTMLEINSWYHVGLIRQGTTFTMYLNAVEDGSLLGISGDTANTDFEVGNAYVSYPFDGVIDEMQVYNRALSATEIQSEYSAQQDVVVVSDTETLYMRSDLYTVNNQTGYGLDSSNTASTATVSQSSVTDTIYYGFRIFLLNEAGYTHELTAGVPVAEVSRATDGVGIQQNTYSMAETKLVSGAEALMVKVYTKVGAAGSWTVKATFLSNPLLADTIDASTWTFSLYTNKTGTEASFSFGSTSAESCIDGLSLTDPDLWGMAMYYFHTNNYIMFFLYPYTRLIGMSPFVSIIIFGIGLTVYVRFRNFYFLLLVLVMLSIGGVLQFIMGDALMGFVALLCTFALGALYWKVFR